MSERGLTRITIAFIFGVAGAGYRYGLCAALAVIGASGLFEAVWLYTRWRRRERDREDAGPGHPDRKYVDTGPEKKAYLWFCVRLFLCIAACLLGAARQRNQQALISVVETYLTEDAGIDVEGKVYKKEEKNGKLSYYLKDSYIIRGEDRIGCHRILVYPIADDVSIGDTIRVTGTAEALSVARNEGNYDERSYYHSKDILFRMTAKSIVLLDREWFLWKESLYRLRKQIQKVYQEQLTAGQAGVLGVMTLGEKEYLDAEIKALYQESGISHVLAISGMHVSILGMGLYRFLRKGGISYLCAGSLAGTVVLLFGQISGMELSTKRAVIMFLIMLLGNVLGMAYDSVTALSFAALLQLWEMPGSLWNAGFLFSYGAVLAVVVAANILKALWKREEDTKRKRHLLFELGRAVLKAWLGTIFMSSCIQLVTLPLSLHFYFEFPVYSVLINSLLLPFMGLVLVFGLLGGLVGLFSPALSGVLLAPAGLLLNWNAWICGRFQGLPGAVRITGRPGTLSMAAYYVLLVLVLCFMWYLKRRRELRHQETRENPLYGCFWFLSRLCVSVVPIIALGLLVFIRPRPEPELCFLDVGQGDGVFLQADNGTTFFLDGGSNSVKNMGEYRILSFLKYRGVDHMDGWFVSHADQDHISGLKELLESGYHIDRLFLAYGIVKDEAWEELCALAEAHGTTVTYLKPGDEVGTRDVRLTCLYPFAQGSDRNAASLVLKLEMSGIYGLLAGDISEDQEKELLREYPDLQADLYKASHHGSNGSNGEVFLQQLSPTVTVISCGKDNSYGHPGAEAVARITESGSRIFMTMEQGQISVGCDERGIWVRTYLSE